MNKPWVTVLFGWLLAGLLTAAEPDVVLRVQTDKPGAAINPAMWGLFFEDINFAADGGLYAELVKNRSFEFADPLMGWAKVGTAAEARAVEVRDEKPPHSAQPHYLRVTRGAEDDRCELVNEGFRGMGVRQGVPHVLSVEARQVSGQTKLRAELIAADGKLLATGTLAAFGDNWRSHTVALTPTATDAKARLKLSFEGAGALDLDMVSLFPSDTWKQRPGGLRADLVQLLADIKPGFIRFPGGCIIEGRTLANRYQWKTTIGPVADRTVIVNRWSSEIRNRAAPDYYQSFGLGFYEYFLLCEDVGAQPLPVLNCGMACQFNTGELCPLDALDPYIQDAIDLVEFANGSAKSLWGAKRAAMGHPEPFKLTMIAIGNEQWGPQYIERYARFSESLRAKCPDVRLVASVGPNQGGQSFDYLWDRVRALKADIVDEHFYRPPDWFFGNTTRYDKYDRSGPQVFAGEYAAHVGNRANSLETALAEAAMMTGFERNAEVVRMASYAPLLGHVEAWQWRPNLIWFDNLNAFATPDYYVQQMFVNNKGSVVLPLELAAGAKDKPARFYGSAVRDELTGDVILKFVNAAPSAIEVSVQLAGAEDGRRKIAQTLLTSARLTDENSLANPRRIAPSQGSTPSEGSAFAHSFPAQSFTVLRISR